MGMEGSGGRLRKVYGVFFAGEEDKRCLCGESIRGGGVDVKDLRWD